MGRVACIAIGIVAFTALITQNRDTVTIQVPVFGEGRLELFSNESIKSVHAESPPSGFWPRHEHGSGTVLLTAGESIAILELFRTAIIDEAPTEVVLELASFVLVDNNGDNMRISVYWGGNWDGIVFSVNGIRCISRERVVIDGREIRNARGVASFVWRIAADSSRLARPQEGQGR